ncbi:hypothetical protein [Paenibacillus sp. MMO-58]|uniref:hypothetical protein n=1 Tax=Paenibacillus sp. MMO-58 TaxID=3081290 RepID=UPI00301AA599
MEKINSVVRTPVGTKEQKLNEQSDEFAEKYVADYIRCKEKYTDNRFARWTKLTTLTVKALLVWYAKRIVVSFSK